MMSDIASSGRRLTTTYITVRFPPRDSRFAFYLLDMNTGATYIRSRAKSFGLPWRLDLMHYYAGILNGMSGRNRSGEATDFTVKMLMILCQAFPRLFAIVMCDTLYPCEDDDEDTVFDLRDLYYDGTTYGFKRLNYEEWPWIRKSKDDDDE